MDMGEGKKLGPCLQPTTRQDCDHIPNMHRLPPVRTQEDSPARHLGGKPGMWESLHLPGGPSQESEKSLGGYVISVRDEERLPV